MKKILTIALLALAAALSLNAQTLVVYYSRSGNNYTSDGIVNLKKGNTQVFAEKIRSLTGADIFRIETVKEYSTDYMECTREAKEEKNANARPALKTDIDISGYDTIYLGWPCWWGTMPMSVYTFLEAHDWSGKTVIPFTTHEGKRMGQRPYGLEESNSCRHNRQGTRHPGLKGELFHETD